MIIHIVSLKLGKSQWLANINHDLAHNSESLRVPRQSTIDWALRLGSTYRIKVLQTMTLNQYLNTWKNDFMRVCLWGQPHIVSRGNQTPLNLLWNLNLACAKGCLCHWEFYVSLSNVKHTGISIHQNYTDSRNHPADHPQLYLHLVDRIYLWKAYIHTHRGRERETQWEYTQSCN